MQAATQVMLSGFLTFGVPLIWAVREVIVLRRPPSGSWPGDEPRPPEPQPLPPDAPKRLPECLIPKLQPMVKPARVLEKV
jgi:hypothetical protein